MSQPPQPPKGKKRSSSSSSRRRKQKASLVHTESSSNGLSNGLDADETKPIIFLLLLWGLIFCMLHVLYVMNYVDNLDEQIMSNQSPTGPSQGQEPHKERPLASVVDVFGAEQKNGNVPNHQLHDSMGAKDHHQDKDRILQILAEANIHNVDEETIRKLPTWSEVAALYGDKPIIHGLEQCERFQQQGDPAEHFASVAGTFNSGTNLMSELLIYNCFIPERQKKYGGAGIRWQVPWGKHNPPSQYRLNRQTYKAEDYTADSVLPAVMIRDPYVWMGSMCRHKYGAHFRSFPDHCPNLIPNQVDVDHKNSRVPDDEKPPIFHPEDETVPVRVDYQSTSVKHDSLAHFYNEWYAEYMNADFPRLMVRFEDLVFFAKEVTETVCHCEGGKMYKHGFKYIVESAKRGIGEHGKQEDRTNLLDAILK